jgi:hypothetical protein
MIKQYINGYSNQKKRRSIHDRHLLQYPSSIPACVYPVQIRLRKNGKRPTSAIQSLYLSLIWRTCHLHFSLCNIPKLISLSLTKTLAYVVMMTRIPIKKCDSGREYILDVLKKLNHLFITIVFYYEIALKKCSCKYACSTKLTGDHC